MKLLIIRPQPGADATARRIRAAGHDPLVMPLFAIEHLAMPPISASDYDAILLTSGNAARAAEDFLKGDHCLPVYAVGSATAGALQKLSVPVAQTGNEGVDTLIKTAAEHGHQRLLWLAGEDHTNISPLEDGQVDVIIVYRSAVAAPPVQFADQVASSDMVVLHSSRAARHFAELCDASGIRRDQVMLATFSNAISRSAGAGWRSIIVADVPLDAALLDAIQREFTTGRNAALSYSAIEGPI